MESFRNKVVVVTGAASGIGRALAEAFAAEGSRIVLADIAEQPLRAEEERLRHPGRGSSRRSNRCRNVRER